MSDLTPQSMRDLAPAFVLDLLEADERIAFERAMAADPSLAREVAEFREAAGLFGAAAAGPAPAPSAALRARVLAEAPTRGAAQASTESRVLPFPAPTAARPPESRPGFVWWAALAASIVLLAASAVQLRKTRQELVSARLAADSTSQQADRLAARLAERERTLRSILSPGVQLVRLTPGSTADSEIRLFVDPATRKVVLYASNLPAAGAGKAYQLWFIRDGEAPLPSVQFASDARGEATVEAIDLPAGALPALAAVTEEVASAAGATSPTMPILLSGPLTR